MTAIHVSGVLTDARGENNLLSFISSAGRGSSIGNKRARSMQHAACSMQYVLEDQAERFGHEVLRGSCTTHC